jgi:hypothetical protein
VSERPATGSRGLVFFGLLSLLMFVLAAIDQYPIRVFGVALDLAQTRIAFIALGVVTLALAFLTWRATRAK